MKKQSILQRSAAFLILLLIGGTIFSSCKKEKTVTPVVAKTQLSTTIDGVAYTVAESGLSGKIFTDAGDAVKSVELNAALDASGRKFTFFINDLKAGKIILDPKTGSSMLPHPNNQIMQRLESINGRLMAGTGSGVQTYARYEFGGSSYYAYSGFFELTYEEATGKIEMKWSITFKDATGKDFTSSGSFVIYIKALTVTPKAEVKDPTPVSATPTIESISPSTGYDGTEIAIAGTNFSATPSENQVKINGLAVTVNSATTTRLVVNAPKSGTTGAVTVKVKNSAVTTGPVFTYALPPTFTAISPATAKAGELITLTGTNFDINIAMNQVQFFSATPGLYVAGIIKSVTATSMVVEVPASAATGILNISVGGRQASRANSFDGVFTLATTVVNPPVNVGTRGMVYNIGAIASAVDGDGNIYSYDDNQVLTKRSNDGTVIKMYTKNDFYTGFPAVNTYKVTAMAADKNGKMHFLMSVGLWPNGEAKSYMATLDAEGRLSKEFETAIYATSFNKMAINSTGEFFLINNDYTDQGILKIKSDGTYTVYLKGFANGEFDGNGAYDLGFGTGDELIVLTYAKPANTSVVPSNQIIYKFTTNKTRTTVFENKISGFNDGALNAAFFKDIRCIAVSGLDIFVGDNGNFRIRKIATRTGTVTTVAGNGKQFDPNNGNMPTYTGQLLGVNIYSVRSLVYDNNNNVLYGGSTQKFVLQNN